MGTKKRIILVVLAAVICITSIVSVVGDAKYVGDNWLKYSHDLTNTGFSTTSMPNTSSLLFQTQLDTGIYGVGAVSISDGRLYITTATGLLYCVDAYTGSILFNQSNLGAISSVPAISGNNVFFGSDDGNIYCCNAINGMVLWKRNTSNFVRTSPAVVNDRIYIGGHNKKLMCLDTNGNWLWNFTTGDIITSSPAIYNNKIYVGSHDGTFYCIDTQGNLLWGNNTGFPIEYAPAIMNGKVYLSVSKTIYCFNADTGASLSGWPIEKQQTLTTAPSPGYGNVYVGAGYFPPSMILYCINATHGTTVWTKNFIDSVWSTPVIADNKVYVVLSGGAIKCMDAQGDSNQGTTLLWNYSADSHKYHYPALYDGKFYVVKDNAVYCFGVNAPPPTPNAPTGEINGLLGHEYTYSTESVVDPNADDVWYLFDWGNGKDSGWLTTPTTSYTWSTIGEYSIKVKTKDNYNIESSWSPELTIHVSVPLPQLDITVTTTVIEQQPFTVTVKQLDTANAVKDAQVIFNGETKQTDVTGKCAFTAPMVDRNTPFTITVKGTGFQSTTATITILNQRELTGWIYGVITDDSHPLEGAQIVISQGEQSWIAYSDSNGLYYKAVTPGVYTVEASKDGYTSQTASNVNIVLNHAIGVDFVLQKITTPQPPPQKDTTNALVESVVQSAITNGYIGAKLSVLSTNKEPVVDYYLDDYTVDLQSTKDLLSFTVSAGNDNPGTFFLVFISKDLSTNPDALKIELDGTTIQQMSIDKFLHPSQDQDAGYVTLSTSTGSYVAVYVPHFSTHTITISSLVTTLSSVAIAVLYILFCLIIGVLILSPAFVSGLYYTYFHKIK
jgi:eukaryotic-like serine/threonine-protein kinase